jgi:UDP-N-acetyl-D-glucosamine dehydrogenase
MWHSLPLSKEVLERSDCVAILTDHSTIDYAKVVACAPLIVDTRNATRAVRNGATNVVLL